DVVAWDVLLLFGGGLTMAAALQSTGAAAMIGAQAGALAGLGEIPMLVGVSTLVTFATEVTSNTALAATMMPLISAAAESIGTNPEALLLCTALCASCAFMMPVATPPNAIVFGTGRLKIGDMVRAGFLLNILGIVVIVSVALLAGGVFL
ncbi:SLC13 family permease, partial [Sutterella parvirubra]